MKTKLLETKRTDLFKIDINAISENDSYNSRHEMGDLKELSKSILRDGVQVPMMVRRDPKNKDKYILIRGHRRRKACLMLIENGDIKDMRVPCQVTSVTDEVELLVDQITSNSGKPLTVLETAEVVSRLSKHNLEPSEIAERLAKSKTFVANMLKLSETPKDIKDMISKGKISSTLVNQIFRTEKNFDEAVVKIQNADINIISENKEKITKKDIDKAENKFNSFGYIKKLVRLNLKSEEPKRIRPEARELYSFILGVISGELTPQEIDEKLFDNGEIQFTTQTGNDESVAEGIHILTADSNGNTLPSN